MPYKIIPRYGIGAERFKYENSRALWCDDTFALRFQITFGVDYKLAGLSYLPVRGVQPWQLPVQ